MPLIASGPIRLAKAHAAGSGPSPLGLPVLIFRLAQELYAIELEEVAETLPFERCTPVPGSPPQFLGVINLRGEAPGGAGLRPPVRAS